MKNQEKKLAKSSNWKTYKGKIKTYGYSLMLVSALGLAGCWPQTLDVKKAAENYQTAIKQLEKAKEKLKDKETALKDAQEEVEEAKTKLKNAQEEVKETKKELKEESEKL